MARLSRAELDALEKSVRSRIASGDNSLTAVKNILSEKKLHSAELEQRLLFATKGLGGKRAGI